jgi:hypothetical protein
MNLKFNQKWTWTVGDIKLILSKCEAAEKPVLHVCSGASNIGELRLDCVKVDSNGMHEGKSFRYQHRGNANILGDMCQLPFKSGMAGTVICDPPYDKSFFDSQGFDNLVCELVRVLKPSGKLIFYSPWVITHPTLQLRELIPNGTGNTRSYYKIMSIHEKFVGQLTDYESDALPGLKAKPVGGASRND